MNVFGDDDIEFIEKRSIKSLKKLEKMSILLIKKNSKNSKDIYFKKLCSKFSETYDLIKNIGLNPFLKNYKEKIIISPRSFYLFHYVLISKKLNIKPKEKENLLKLKNIEKIYLMLKNKYKNKKNN